MNPVFILLVILSGVLLWFSINSLFPVIGDFICGLWEETKFNIEQNDDDEEKGEF
jgi:hypothetical protein